MVFQVEASILDLYQVVLNGDVLTPIPMEAGMPKREH
jgi:hypothetical protein